MQNISRDLVEPIRSRSIAGCTSALKGENYFCLLAICDTAWSQAPPQKEGTPSIRSSGCRGRDLANRLWGNLSVLDWQTDIYATMHSDIECLWHWNNNHRQECHKGWITTSLISKSVRSYFAEDQADHTKCHVDWQRHFVTKCFRVHLIILISKSDHGCWHQSTRQRHMPSEKAFSISIVMFVEVRCSALTRKLLARLESIIISAKNLWQLSQHYSRATNMQRITSQTILIDLIILRKSITK
jgi:hypothetical protein